LRTDIRTFLIKFVQPRILALLSPEHIAGHPSLEFIPKDKNFPTRYVGSWVCVCVSAALLMVPPRRPFFLLKIMNLF
jgi:hypothetical protein